MERAEWGCQQYFQLPFFSVLLASALIGTHDEGSPRNSSSRDLTETGTRMDEDYNGETTPVNNLECKAEEKTSHIVLVNSTCFSTFS